MILSFGITVLLLATLISGGLPRYALRQITQMRLQTKERIYEYLERTGVYSKDRFDRLDKRKIQVTSQDGLLLSGYVLEFFPDSHRWMIIVHGYTVSLHVSTQYIDMFRDAGFNILLIDQRRHGGSQGKYTTYGYYEKYDVQTWVNWILEHYGEQTEIGLHGQSLGGGTVLEYLSIAHPNVKFVIADCPYSDLTELMRHQFTKLNKLPAYPLLPLVNRLLQRKAGFRLDQVSPIKAVEKSRLPVLFIHGTKDNYVPTYMSKEMYRSKPEPKRLLLIEGAVHANAYGVDPKRYRTEVHSFIHEVLGAEKATETVTAAYLPSI
ncbi:alpha/beta hydrolase [Paenibacillus oralis]|uniref:Alpha/beta hydrolase n=1 Tax=Paenibacillus oralis TaxID=2490856 RepID=A0A3P3U138_9BACL|nr:alpha/beta hydrolase [Paenibacillus oralis]RRJ63774.1 alpha/beta hydrolase [Paenibacillus oralis]